jgi:Ca-activated chloride channel homolog
LKTVTAILLFTLLINSAFSQYYLRGEIRDETDNTLPNAKMLLHSTRYVYYSGSSGAFGILTSSIKDSLTISLEGYYTVTVPVETSKFQVIRLKLLQAAVIRRKDPLFSFTKNLTFEGKTRWNVAGETYSALVENEFVPAEKYPETGFAIHSDKASYSNVRRFLNMNTQVPPDAVRPEEMLNYFNFGYTSPPADSVFGFHSYVSDCPWNPLNRILFLQGSAKKLDPDKIPPSNLVFLIDISGSMDMPNRLPLLKSSFKLLVDNLRDKDTISIVVYGSTVGVWLTPTSGKEKEKIRKAIEELQPGGATAGGSGILAAYRIAKSQYIKNGNNRVILATDGDFNVGQSSDEDLEKLITQHQQSGIYLTCLGVGMGNYKDSKLEVLAKKGNGNFAYLDNEREAEKVLVKELTQTLYTVADDTYLDIRFNPKRVKTYRLIGYDNRLKALTDTLNAMEGGEVGSGYSMMVLFEYTPEIGFPEEPSYDELAKVSIHYRLPSDSLQRFTAYSCVDNYTPFNELKPCYRFATSVALFASLLKESRYTRKTSWTDAIILANESYDHQDIVQEEFITMIEKAKKIYGKKRRRE